MPEQLIIKSTPSGVRHYISRARLGSVPVMGLSDGRLTEVGRKLGDALSLVDGIEVTFNPHFARIGLVHAALWSWDEVEPGIVAAWAQVLGGQPEIIREGAP